jgi:hypothetical protein
VLETQRRQNKQKTQHKSLTNEDEQKTTEHRRTEQKHYIENYKMKTNKTKNTTQKTKKKSKKKTKKLGVKTDTRAV